MTETLQVVCPACQTTNRIVTAKINASPQCGKCHGALFSGQPLTLNATTFALQVQRSDIPLLIDFWADWCGPCKMMAPAFQQAAGLLEPRVRLGKINTETEPQISGQFGIRSIPTLILLVGGREIARQSGAMGAQDIVRWTLSHLR